MTNNQLWQATLGELELLLSKANFTTWFKNTFIASQEGPLVVIGVPNGFTKAWLENKYHDSILKALRNVTGEEVKEVVYKVESKKTSFQALGAIKVPTKAVLSKEDREEEVEYTEPRLENKFGLNLRYTFENFIVGKGNELAQAAARAVVEKPGKVYNPLFIYGGVGLGKTHLLQAIGHEVLKCFNNKKVLYTTCEKFTNDFVQSIKRGTIDDFKERYRGVDILLIDDIHFISGKEQTQEQFFHTFNELHQNNKQIVISSDRAPKAILALEQRLLSRFEWGMTVDIQEPDLETRIAILEAKLNEKAYSLDRSIIHYLATTIQRNIRELEGALNRIIAHHKLANNTPTLESVKSIIQALVSYPKRGALTSKQLLKTVASFYDITIEDLIGKSRKKELVVPRQIVMYLMREEIKSSFPNIGQELGGRDHTTAIHACTKIIRIIEDDEKIRQDITLIKERLYNQV